MIDLVDILLYVILVILGMAIGTSINSDKEELCKDAILHGVAEYTVDSTGTVSFNWITNNIDRIN